MRETNGWCSVEGTARYLMHARNQIKCQRTKEIVANVYLPVQQALAESRENTDMSIKPSYVTKNKQDEN